MPAHLFAYTANAGAGDALANLTALADAQLSRRNNNYVLQRDASLRWAWLGATSLTRGRIRTPSMRIVTNTEIRPYTRAAVPDDDPNVADYRRNPPVLKSQEEIEIQYSNNLAMGNERTTFVGLLDMGVQPAAAGQSWWLRGSSTTAAVANVWSLLAVVWDDDLPQGNWVVTGLEVQSTSAQAARLVFDDDPWRPGSLSITALGNRNHELFLEPDYMMGRFSSWRMPEVEVLANGADAAHEVYLRIQRG